LKSTYSCGVPQFATHLEVAPEGHVAMACVKLSGTHDASHWCGSFVPFSPVYSRHFDGDFVPGPGGIEASPAQHAMICG
jgi:hypothetical protein